MLYNINQLTLEEYSLIQVLIDQALKSERWKYQLKELYLLQDKLLDAEIILPNRKIELKATKT